MKNYLLIITLLYNYVVSVLFFTETLGATDTLTLLQSVSASMNLTSLQEKFQLGFFSPGNSGKFYLGIWYNRISEQTVVWVANRGVPLNDTNGVLHLRNDGNLILLDGTERTIWSTSIPNSQSRTTVAQLLDSGNLVLRDSNGEGSFLWQSFEHPSHAMVAGMKIGHDLRTGLNLNLTSWKSFDDPSPGEYTFGIDLQGLPQAIIWKGSSKQFRTGPWNGKDFGGLVSEIDIPFTPVAIVNSKEVYYEYSVNSTSYLIMAEVNSFGIFQFLRWDFSGNEWIEQQKIPQDVCGDYGYCGPNSICDSGNGEPCDCLIGYMPKDAEEWKLRIYRQGCIRKYPLNCPKGEGFIAVDRLKMPDLLEYWVNISMSQKDCETECLRNCSCEAYTYTDVRVRRGCLLWFGDLMDVRKLTLFVDQTLYIRVTASDLDRKSNKKKMVAIVVVTFASIFLLLGALCIIWKKKSCRQGQQQGVQVTDGGNLELPCFHLSTIAKATQHFSDENKIGEGGFGPVYKGVLPNGQEIAVKRLSEDSFQGHRECKNEISLIAKLQHRNLVRLLGYCIQGEERILLYEFMPNGSLDSYLFGGSDHNKRHLLVWRRRISIIVGIARGLLYLHQDSRLRIVHRDLKASNVLLGSEMNPKISDFGMARAFADEQLMTKTRMVAGTYGYMAPEYAIRGIFSMKSDVYSFGVLVLEIVSGQRNSIFHHPDHDFNLLGHAWHLWVEGRASDLIDPSLEDSFPLSEVMRCIQVGLLCVQQRPDDRPTMSSVLLMLNSESPVLHHQPNRPGFYKDKLDDDDDTASLSAGKLWTANDSAITTIEGR